MKTIKWFTIVAAVFFFAACGEDGAAGKLSLVKTSDEPAGDNCLYGGIRIEAGIDTNGNSTLDPNEVKDIRFVCNGNEGLDGTDGTDGKDGLDGTDCTVTDNGDGTKTIACGEDTTVTVSDGANGADGTDCTVTDNEDDTKTITCGDTEVTVSNGTNGTDGHDSLVVIDDAPTGTCPNGGQKVTVGIDLNDNGILDADEITATKYICAGIDGNDSLTVIDPVDPGADCAAGGYEIVNGVDTDGDGTLDAGEIVSDVFVCNGVDGTDGHSAMTETTPLEPGDGGCVAGGSLFKTGIDMNDNGILDDGEYEEVTVCNGEKGDPGEDGVCAGNHAPVIDSIVIAPPDGIDDTYKLNFPYTVTVNATDEDGDGPVYKIVGGYATIAAGATAGEFTVTPRAEGGPFSFAVIVSDGCQITMGDLVIEQVMGDPWGGPWLNDSDLYFSNVSGDGFTVSWMWAGDDYTDEENLEYKVVYALDPNDIDSPEKIEAGGGTIAMDWTKDTYTTDIAGLDDGIEYWVAVLVRDEYHLMNMYNINNQSTVDVTAPVTDGTIWTSDITETTLSLSWSEATDNATAPEDLEFKVVYSTDPADIDTEQEVSDMMGPGVLVSWGTDIYVYDVAGLEEGILYYFNVAVRDEDGNVTLYGVQSVRTRDLNSPDPVSGIYAIGLNNRVYFRWDDPGDPSLDHYEVTWTPDDPATPAIIPAKGFFRHIDGLTNDTEYTFTIVAVDGTGNSSDEETITATPKDPGMGYAINGSLNSSSNPAETKLYRLDPSTAQTTLIGATDVWNANGLAVNPADDSLYLFATNWDDGIPSLYTLDPLTGESTFIGSPDSGNFAWTSDIAFSADGMLYGWGRNYDDAYIIDLVTAQGTFLGDSGVSGNTAGIAFTPDGDLIMKSSNTLNTIDLETGAGANIGSIDVQYFEDETGSGWNTLRNVLEISDTGIGFSVIRTSTSSYLYAFDFNSHAAIPVGDMKVAGISAVTIAHTFKPFDQQFSGIKRNLPQALLTDWEVCYTDTYADSGDALTDILTDCNGDNLMLACRPVGSSLFTLAAWAKREDVTYDTGTDSTTVQNSNGVDWYFNTDYSWGFAPEGEGVNKSECDTNSGPTRLCWHTLGGGGTMSGGYRCGADMDLNSDESWERVILQYTPE